jgi:hypothetical protein
MGGINMAHSRDTNEEDKFKTVFKEELAHVESRWNAKADKRHWSVAERDFKSDEIRGIAFSGGGIRSASFCMGVLQQLHLSGVLDRAHYMSTVSGGGYTGSSLTWFMTKGFGTTPNDFPFWGGVPAGLRNASSANLDRTKERTGPLDGRVVLDYIRQRSSYLNPGAGFTVLSAIAIVLRSVLTALFGYILLFALLFSLGIRSGAFNEPLAGAAIPKAIGFLGMLDWLALGGLGLILLLLASIFLYSLATGLPGSAKAAYTLRRGYQNWAGAILGGAIALLLTSLIAFLVQWLSDDFRFSFKEISALGTGSTVLGTVGGFIVNGLRSAKPTVVSKLMLTLLPPLFLLLLVTGLALVGAPLGAYAVKHGGPGLLALTLVTLIYCVITNINLTGLHRFYRDRLMETFLPDPATIPQDREAAETDADMTDLADVCGPNDDGPYHLINANVVLLGSSRARQRSRMGDSFLLSPLYCGSEATGYIKTRNWLPGNARFGIGRRVGAMKLATAMAISGAALNPRAGGDGQGPTKGGAISALLNLLNLRLGYWVPSPKKFNASFRLSYASPPNFLLPGLIQGLVGSAHNEQAHWIELSDGGHFENTGVYELVRRGVRTIVFADGSTDPDISLGSLANVLEKVYIDFGVKVDFRPDADFIRMLKGTAKDSVLTKRLELSEKGFAIATLRYPSGPPGLLFYIKSTLIPALPASLYSYKAGNPLFPAESLADQFFSEQQFEAYRSLGYLLTEAMMKEVLADEGLATALGVAHVPSKPQPAPPSPPAPLSV